MTRAAACPSTDTTTGLTGATWRRAAGLETSLSIVSAKGVSFACDWSRFPTLGMPERKGDKPDNGKSSEDNQHGDGVYESA